MQEVALTAPDIACGHCIESIRKAVTKLAGGEFVGGDPATKQVSLRVDESRGEVGENEEGMGGEDSRVRGAPPNPPPPPSPASTPGSNPGSSPELSPTPAATPTPTPPP